MKTNILAIMVAVLLAAALGQTIGNVVSSCLWSDFRALTQKHREEMQRLRGTQALEMERSREEREWRAGAFQNRN